MNDIDKMYNSFVTAMSNYGYEITKVSHSYIDEFRAENSDITFFIEKYWTWRSVPEFKVAFGVVLNDRRYPLVPRTDDDTPKSYFLRCADVVRFLDDLLNKETLYSENDQSLMSYIADKHRTDSVFRDNISIMSKCNDKSNLEIKVFNVNGINGISGFYQFNFRIEHLDDGDPVLVITFDVMGLQYEVRKDVMINNLDGVVIAVIDDLLGLIKGDYSSLEE